MNEITVAVAAAILLPVGGLMIKLFQLAMTWQAQSNAEKERTISRLETQVARERERAERAEARVEMLERNRTMPP